MEFKQSEENENLNISLYGDFTLSDDERFNQILQIIGAKSIVKLTLDTSEICFIDSSAMGMLLLLREETKKNNINLILTGVEGHLKKMMILSHFNSLFNIK